MMEIDKTKNWYSLSGKKINDISNEIKETLEEYKRYFPENKSQIMIGTDSQRHGNIIVYVTALAVISGGHGGRAYYVRQKESIPGITLDITTSRRKEIIKGYIIARLWNETILSVEYANYINQLIIDTGIQIKDIHCDINSNKKYKSSDIVKSTIGYVQGLGFNCVVKPYGWVASCISNSKTK